MNPLYSDVSIAETLFDDQYIEEEPSVFLYQALGESDNAVYAYRGSFPIEDLVFWIQQIHDENPGDTDILSLDEFVGDYVDVEGNPVNYQAKDEYG